MGVGDPPLDEREVRAEAVLKHVLSATEFPAFLAFRQWRSHRGRRVERRDSSSAGADALRERSLRNQFQFRAPASVELGEDGELAVRGNEQTTLETRPALSSAARPTSPLPQLLLIIVKFVAPWSISAWIESRR